VARMTEVLASTVRMDLAIQSLMSMGVLLSGYRVGVGTQCKTNRESFYSRISL